MSTVVATCNPSALHLRVVMHAKGIRKEWGSYSRGLIGDSHSYKLTLGLLREETGLSTPPVLPRAQTLSKPLLMRTRHIEVCGGGTRIAPI